MNCAIVVIYVVQVVNVNDPRHDGSISMILFSNVTSRDQSGLWFIAFLWLLFSCVCACSIARSGYIFV